MKTLFVIILCIAATKGFSQTADVMVEEKSSEWIKVTSPAVISKPRTTIKKTTTANKREASKQAAQEEFEKTNQQVNRFKKQKKGSQ